MEKEVSAVTKVYDLALWLLPHVAKFPRAHRFTLGDRIEAGVLDALELLTEASYVREKTSLLRQAGLRLERLRYLIRLAKDLNILTIPQYEFAARAIVAIGVEVSGWTKHQTGKHNEET